MMFLIDTNVISELRKIPLGDANVNVSEWAMRIPEEHIFISVVSIMEIKRGILTLQRRDPTQAKIIQQWFENIIKAQFQSRILPINLKTAEICATLHAPNKRPENDAWIAAIALEHNLTLATRNVKDFDIAELKIFNPWDL
ncbi:type II toxin-antitoxin system VapC family toxin [Lonepinella koalarum]|uniref:type II toxin-antitoxin system VapC family toxin n=1 Tax=Lonepinella koalarum TaxID=53417 RepID=UPI001E33A682|nr:type II toxin-antitoxin system VapC family toxin [Lonepinella koalarum]